MRYLTSESARFLTASPEDIVIDAYEPGGYDREKQRHRQFAVSRKAGTELFDRTPELEAHITDVVSMFGDPKQFI